MTILNASSANGANVRSQHRLSLLLAGTIIFTWFLSLIWLLNIDVSWDATWIVIGGTLLRTFLQTGLFIVAHESIHGTLCENKRLGRCIGHLTAILYAFISYRLLFEKHQLHHLYPGTDRDPDFRSQGSQAFLGWYISFFSQYYRDQYIWESMAGMAAIFSLLISLGMPLINIFAFWLLPIILSSLQLFYFGVYLPHRTTDTPINNVHRARSNHYPELLSLITCYHFGYHLEHHQRPDVPWHRLPKIHHRSQSHE